MGLFLRIGSVRLVKRKCFYIRGRAVLSAKMKGWRRTGKRESSSEREIETERERERGRGEKKREIKRIDVPFK